jgi:hypothetical protein
MTAGSKRPVAVVCDHLPSNESGTTDVETVKTGLTRANRVTSGQNLGDRGGPRGGPVSWVRCGSKRNGSHGTQQEIVRRAWVQVGCWSATVFPSPAIRGPFSSSRTARGRRAQSGRPDRNSLDGLAVGEGGGNGDAGDRGARDACCESLFILFFFFVEDRKPSDKMVLASCRGPVIGE